MHLWPPWRVQGDRRALSAEAEAVVLAEHGLVKSDLVL